MSKKFTIEEYNKLAELGLEGDKLTQAVDLFFPEPEPGADPEPSEQPAAPAADNKETTELLKALTKQVNSLTSMVQAQNVKNSGSDNPAPSPAAAVDEVMKEFMGPPKTKKE